MRAHASSFLVPLSEVADTSEVGGKAASLAGIAGLGIPTSPGFVIPNSVFQSFLELNRLSASEPSKPVGAAIRSAELPLALLECLDALCPEVAGWGAAAVRSSAVGEDSADASFAGQLDTVLDVDTPEALRSAVLKCWASYWSPRCLAYQRASGVKLQGMGVIVQRLVRSCLSGVLFTVPPAGAARPGEMLLEYCYGLGEQLVGGKINPGVVHISRQRGICSRICPPEGTENRGAERLLETALTNLGRLGLQLENHFAAPQDVEWAIDGSGALFVLQSRPITVAAKTSGAANRDLLSNANINENYSKPVSPFLYSLASSAFYYYFRNLGTALGISRRDLEKMELPLRNIVCAPGSRLHYNLTSIYRCLHAAPFGSHLASMFNAFVGIDSPSHPAPATPHGDGACRLRNTAKALLLLARTPYLYLTLPRRVRQFEAAADAFDADCTSKPWTSKTAHELNADLLRFLSIRFHGWTGASLADAAAMLSTGLLNSALARWLPARDSQAAAASVLKGLKAVSVMPAVGLWEIAQSIRRDDRLASLFRSKTPAELERDIEGGQGALREQLDRYVRQWGFRCSGELMLTEPNFEDDRKPLLQLLKSYVSASSVSPLDHLEQQRREGRLRRRQVLAQMKPGGVRSWLPSIGKWMVVRFLFATAARSLSLRERARLKQALVYGRCRRILLAVGDVLAKAGRLGSREDIFLFTYREVDEILGGRYLFAGHLADIAASRRAQHAAVSSPQFADNFPSGDAPKKNDDPSAEAGRTVMRGSGACGGTFTGRAAVLADLSEVDRLTAGDILVTRQTDPGWGALLFLVKGLVIERGGMLSHGAIIAREFGIPAVIGVPNATGLIEHHQTVTVDGDSGLVHLDRP